MIIKYSEYSFAPYLFRPNKDQITRITRIGYVHLLELQTIERYKTLTYRLQKLHVCMEGVYLSSKYL